MKIIERIDNIIEYFYEHIMSKLGGVGVFIIFLLFGNIFKLLYSTPYNEGSIWFIIIFGLMGVIFGVMFWRMLEW